MDYLDYHDVFYELDGMFHGSFGVQRSNRCGVIFCNLYRKKHTNLVGQIDTMEEFQENQKHEKFVNRVKNLYGENLLCTFIGRDKATTCVLSIEPNEHTKELFNTLLDFMVCENVEGDDNLKKVTFWKQ